MRAGLALFLAALVVYHANLREISSADTAPNRLLPAIIVLEQRLYLDSFFRLSPPPEGLPYWAQRVGDHYVSLYPVLPALLALPVYVLPVWLWGVPSWAFLNALAKATATLWAALSVLLLYLALRRLVHRRAAVWMALVYAFGTSTWSISSQGLWAHGPAELFLAAAIYWAVRAESEGRSLAGVGLAAGLMVASRPATGLMAGALLLYVLWRDRRQGAQALGLFALALLPSVVYNLWSFGAVFGGYAELHATHPERHHVAGPVSTMVGQNLLGLLASPSRGLLVYSPVLALALVGVARSLVVGRPLLRCLAAGFAASLLALGAYSVWWGGHSFGPRLLTDFLPALVVCAATLVGTLERVRPLRVAFLVLFAASVAVQAVGAFYYPSPWRIDWNTSPRDVDLAHERLWDWRDFQLLRLLRNGPRAPGFEP